MGLDMYLTKKIYLGAKWDHNNVKGTIYITKGENNTPVKIDLKKVSEICEEAGYWRKANHIHNWMVKNIQEGKDDCGEYYIGREKMKELKKVCDEVVRLLDQCEKTTTQEDDFFSGKKFDYHVYNVTEDVKNKLPTAKGFFFGGTEYDMYYYQSLKDTIEIMDYCLSDPEADYYYRSSW